MYKYKIYLSLLGMGKDDFLKNAKLFAQMSDNQLGLFATATEKFTVFDMISLNSIMANRVGESLSFFMNETVKWDTVQRKYSIFEINGGDEEFVGEITRDNFDEIRHLILQLNFVELNTPESQTYNPRDKNAKRLWEIAQKHINEHAKNTEDKKHRLGNIISKLVAIGAETYHTIWDLSIFQTYMLFMEIGYLRARSFAEQIYSYHGSGKGDKFNYQEWLSPILDA
jgi:hypothetical protein